LTRKAEVSPHDMTTIVSGKRGLDVDREVSATQSRRAWWPDAALAVALGIVAILYRREFPSDGLFHDDAWQALGATRGTFSQLLTVGQTQPGFGLELMVWSRVVGHTVMNMITPALIAGCLGPPGLYLVLRRFGFARSVATLLGSALVVSAMHIVYSGRVKAYTSEVLFVLVVIVVVPWLARRSWGVATAVAWVVGSMLVASFSSFTMLVTVGAAVILVLHRQNDVRLRVAAVAAQAVGVVALLAAVDRTHSAEPVTTYFDGFQAFISLSANPVTFGSDVFRHLTRITEVFPGGPAWFRAACVVLVSVGLVAAALGRGRRAIAARLMIVLVLLAFAGALMHRVPFGPSSDPQGLDRPLRVTLWLVPIVAFGLAVVLQRVRRAVAQRSSRMKVGFDALAFSCAVVLLLTPIGVHRPYPDGWLAGTRDVMDTIGPHDVAFIQWRTAFSFAFNTDVPARIQAMSDTDVGFAPRFLDTRLHIFGLGLADQRQAVAQLVKNVDRVVVFQYNVGPTGYHPFQHPFRLVLVRQLKGLGFVPASVTLLNRASIVVYRRQ
jgi:hypothetical protein